MAYLKQIRRFLTYALVLVAPFHAFLVTWAGVGGFSVAGMWREISVVIICGIIFAEGVIVKIKDGRKWYEVEGGLDGLDLAILGFILLSVLFAMEMLFGTTATSGGFRQWALGFRYDILPFVFLLFCRHAEWEKAGNIIRAALVSGLIVGIFGILQSAVLPQDFLTKFGYTNYQGEFSVWNGVPACQFLEHSSKICRAMSTFGGPTRYGVYLLLLLGLAFPFFAAKFSDNKAGTKNFCYADYRWSANLFAICVFANIIFTFSRSIWIGLGVAVITAFFFFTDRKIKNKLIISAVIAILLAAGAWQLVNIKNSSAAWPPPFVRTIFLRDFSTGEHMRLLQNGLKIVAEHPLGIGLGTAGPASVRFTKLLTENWFLQIAVEMGVIGFALFVYILFSLCAKLVKDKNNLRSIGLFLAIISISITGLFTHSFEETSAILPLMLFCGIVLSRTRSSRRQH